MEATKQLLFNALKEQKPRNYIMDVYLTKRTTSVPESYLDEDVMTSIRDMYFNIFHAITRVLEKNVKVSTSILIEPSIDSKTCLVILLNGKDIALHRHRSKAWNFYYENISELKNFMYEVYEEVFKKVCNILGGVDIAN
jgi:DNA topoisomerase IB